MGGLNDKWISSQLKGKRPFEKSDGDGLTLVYREGYQTPVWRLRYRFAGKPRVMVLGSFGDVSLAKARETARTLRARVTLGHDVADEKQERQREAVAKIDAKKNVFTVAKLADEFFTRKIMGHVKHPNIVRSRIEKDIKPNIGKLPVKEVKPRDIRDMLAAVVERGAPTVANDVLRVTLRIFNEAVKDGVIEYNPAAAYDYTDAGGQEKARERSLSRDELVKFFAAMRKTPGFSVENTHTFKLLVLLAVRKSELVMARVSEFDLKAAMWALPAERTKTEAAIDIPLSASAVEALRELVRLGDGSDYLLPARKAQDRMLPHIHENTLNVALSKVRKLMPDVENFTIHDLRRTARTHIGKLKVAPHIAEKCLNHKTKGVAGTYDKHDYFDERRDALATWAEFVDACEAGHGAMTKWVKAFDAREDAKRKAKR
ncbi:MAG TPA: integrase arm-type DNA-binding domain-containing protein [Steroidobacteraceae bacterium]|jgi:integrase|nr:integrase arm-type DNA-binding domain-containing protein [Steroidobacteraceae bacterium]